MVQRDPSAIAGVVNLAADVRRARGLEIQLGHVFHISEVARLLAIAENLRRRTRKRRFYEQREHARIGARRILPRPVHVEVAQRHRLQPEHAGKDVAVILAHQLLQGVRRFRPGRHLLDLGQDFRIAVGRRGCRVDDAAGASLLRRPQNVERSIDVALMRRNRVVDRARHGGNRRLVKHHRRAANNRRDGRVVANIGALKLEGALHLFEIPFIAGEKIVDHDHLPRALAQQRAHNGGTDEARASGDDVTIHAPCASKCRSDSSASRSAPA